jgi:hypothetical protein
MAIGIQERFEVAAPIEAVWRFVMDPRSVATCMPGAALEEVIDERTFVGSIQVRVGAITTHYRGRVRLTDVDEETHAVRMVAEGKEAAGGTAKGEMSSRLRALPGGRTEVVAVASLDLTGRVAQMGRGMIEGVSRELFRQFAARTRERLEASAAAPSPAASAGSPPISLLALLARALWSAILRLLRRLLRRPAA